jgi:hypothetical protein
MKSKITRNLGLALFVVGALAAIFCAGIAAWGDMEASLFDSALAPEAPLNIQCPILITTAETATVSTVVDNYTDRPVQTAVRAHFSQGHVTLIREVSAQLSLAPGEQQQLEWTVGPEDAAFGRVILVRIHVLRSGALPYRAGACGIVVVGLPFLTGGLFWGLLVAVSLLSMGGGIALWVLVQRPLLGQGLAVTRMMGVLAGILVIAIFVGFLGLWLIGLLLLLFTVLFSGIMIGFVLTSR